MEIKSSYFQFYRSVDQNRYESLPNRKAFSFVLYKLYKTLCCKVIFHRNVTQRFDEKVTLQSDV